MFLNKPPQFWDGLSSLSTTLGAAFVVVTAWLAYRQFKIMVRSAELEGIKHMQELMDGLRPYKAPLYAYLSPSTVATADQFAAKPPSPDKEGSEPPRKLTPRQIKAAKELMSDPALKNCAENCMNRLCDLGQLLEDGFLRRRLFLGKYHVTIIHLCHMLEPVRQIRDQNGNFGQRMLRLRHMAIDYNACIPKHRRKNLTIKLGKSGREVTLVKKHSQASLVQKVRWYIRRKTYYAT